MGSALLNPAAQASADLAPISPVPESPDELRRQVAARLAAHRERRLRKDEPLHDNAPAFQAPQDAQKLRIAASVAERYGKAQSYRAFLAAEAERAEQQARAAAEVAQRNARAVAEARQRLLDDLARQARSEPSAAMADPEASSAPTAFAVAQALWPELDKAEPAGKHAGSEAGSLETVPPARKSPKASPERPTASPEAPALRVLLYDATPAAALSPTAPPAPTRRRHDYGLDPEALALDEEISFRQSPVFEEPAGPPMPLPANLIEFPRQLVAPRKVRPRYAEGPLREEGTPENGRDQLRIFEVLPTQVSTEPQLAASAATPEAQWTSLWLDTPGALHAPAEHAASVEDIPAPAAYVLATPKLYTAKLSRRALAGAIDLAITALAGLASAAAFTATMAAVAHQSPWQLAALRAAAAQVLDAVSPGTLAVNGGIALFLLSLVLQAIFFTFSDATPGMRVARIGLCTFADENPSRAAMRLRIPALVLSTALLGLGFWWALLDQDRLTWHDLISRMYQRSY